MTWPIGLPLPSVRITVAPASAVPLMTTPLLGSITGAGGAMASTVTLAGPLVLPAGSWATALITVPSYQVSGLKNGDSAGSILTGGLNRAAGENVGVYGINQGDLALNSGNYDLSYQGNNLTITKALLNVIADDTALSRR